MTDDDKPDPRGILINAVYDYKRGFYAVADPALEERQSEGGAMTEEELAALEKLASDATPGPWLAAFVLPEQISRVFSNSVEQIATGVIDGNARFIAAMRTAVPELIAEIRRLRKL